MAPIRIGLERTPDDLRLEILSYPERFFFIMGVEGRPALCISTCDGRGEDVRDHVIDGLTPDADGNLVSLFQPRLEDAFVKIASFDRDVLPGDLFAQRRGITAEIIDLIGLMPGLSDWIVSSMLMEGRSIVFQTALDA